MPSSVQPPAPPSALLLPPAPPSSSVLHPRPRSSSQQPCPSCSPGVPAREGTPPPAWMWVAGFMCVRQLCVHGEEQLWKAERACMRAGIASEVPSKTALFEVPTLLPPASKELRAGKTRQRAPVNAARKTGPTSQSAPSCAVKAWDLSKGSHQSTSTTPPCTHSK